MVRNTRIVFDPPDIVQMRIVCTCGGESTYPFNRTFNLPRRCPFCDVDWWNPYGPLTNALTHARNLALAVHYFLDPTYAAEVAELKFKIQLELDE